MNVEKLEKMQKIIKRLIDLKRLKKQNKKLVVSNPLNSDNPLEVMIPEKDFKILEKKISEKEKKLKELISSL